MLEWLIEWDRISFLYINTKFVNSFFDEIMPVLRHRNTWIPLYVLILAVVVWKMKLRSIPWILCLVAAVGFADIISSHIFKPYFERLRPCNELSPVFDEMILRLKRCSGHNSFTSSHAANHGAIAFFIFWAGAKHYRKYLSLFIAWALIICWAQIYVGVHYPLDIIGGLLTGMLTAFISLKIYNILKNKKIFTNGNKSKDTTGDSRVTA